MGLRKVTFFLLISFAATSVFGQYGGQNAFVSSNLIFSARMAALGANGQSVKDGDLNLGTYNPSLLDSTNHGQFSFSYINYISNINYGQAAYATHFRNIGTFALSINYLGYGQLTETNIYGDEIGNFKAGEYRFTLSGARQIDSLFSIGANINYFQGQMANYFSSGISADIAGTYANAKKGTTISLMLNNIGTQFKSYTSNDNAPMPFEIQLALSQKFKNAPFRFLLLLENLQTWKLVNEGDVVEERDPLTGEIINKSKDTFGENLARHLVFGVEVLIGKSVFLRGGYNYRRRQELKVEDRPGISGISFGLGFRVSKFHFSYSRAAYNAAGASNHLTVTTKFSDFKSKK
jgi:hypothetical protein